MVDFRLKDPAAAMTAVIDDNATLATTARAAGDYDNSTGGGGGGDPFCLVYLTVQFDTGPPTAGDEIAELYILPGSAEATELYPDGGDAGLGTDDDPQDVFYVGSFETINPSTTVNEVLALGPIPLYPSGNRFVLKNVSGQTFDATWQLEIQPFKWESN